MKKMVLMASFMALVSGLVQAGEGRVEFDFFDTAVSQAKKFEDAFRQNDRITGVNIDGRSFSLGGEWTVLNSWSSMQDYKTGDKKATLGTLVLGKISEKKLEDTLMLTIRLQPPVARDFMTNISTVCNGNEKTVFSEVSRAEDKYQSCMQIRMDSYVDKGSDAGRVERTVKGYAAAYGLSIQPNGANMYSVGAYESKNATAVYASRYVVRDGSDLEELKRFVQDLRRSIRRSFFRE